MISGWPTPTSQPSCVWLSKLQALSEGLPFDHQFLCLFLSPLQIRPRSWDLNHEWLRSRFPSWRKLCKFENEFISKVYLGHCLLWNQSFNFKITHNLTTRESSICFVTCKKKKGDIKTLAWFPRNSCSLHHMLKDDHSIQRWRRGVLFRIFLDQNRRCIFKCQIRNTSVVICDLQKFCHMKWRQLKGNSPFPWYDIYVTNF